MKIKQERERKEKRKEKVTSTKLEVCTPHTHTPLMDGRASKMIQTLLQKP
jgi:hypothetical protein